MGLLTCEAVVVSGDGNRWTTRFLTNVFTVIFKIELEGHWMDASMEILSEQI